MKVGDIGSPAGTLDLRAYADFEISLWGPRNLHMRIRKSAYAKKEKNLWDPKFPIDGRI